MENEMSRIRQHAEIELKAIGYTLDEKEDEYNKLFVNSVFELLDVFERQGHSGFSAPACIATFSKLAKFEPLSPLTGADDEWHDCGDDNGETLYQNKRASHVFKENGQAYDIEGKVFREPDGCCFTSKESRVNITFPYTPKTEYIDVERKD